MPIIPNEIYFTIFEHIGPPTRRLSETEADIFANLACVCRFFANFCLPRVFEYVSFPGYVYYVPPPSGTTLCIRIAAKQPLTLALAKLVKGCSISSWRLKEWPIVEMYIAAMLHMTNIRELEFVNSFVGVEHWDAIATLESLEKLTFYGCNFPHWQGPADVGPKKRIKVPHLRVNGCPKLRPPIAAIDPRYLRTLAVDNKFFDHVDWLSPSALTELYITILPWQTIDATLDHMQRLHTILVQAHQSRENHGFL